MMAMYFAVGFIGAGVFEFARRQAAAATKQAMWVSAADSSSGSINGGWLPRREDIGPLFLLLICPSFVITMWHTAYALDGSFVALFQARDARRRNALLNPLR